jgi:hypothetical protein
MTLSVKTILDTLYSIAFLAGGAGWIIGHYVLEKHAPEAYIVGCSMAMIAYGAWRLQHGDITAFGKAVVDVAKEARKAKDGDNGN